jgi:hypothetical protein
LGVFLLIGFAHLSVDCSAETQNPCKQGLPSR